MLEKTSVENKEVYQMDDFNINRLNYESSWKTSDFLKNLHSQSGASCNTASSHHTQVENTDLYSIFFNEVNEAAIFWNLITDISDHHAHVLITQKNIEKWPK